MNVDNGNVHTDGMSLDHKIPLSRGGSNTVKNLVVCCHRCNIAKGAMTADEFIRFCDNFDENELNTILDTLYKTPSDERFGLQTVVSLTADSWRDARFKARQMYKGLHKVTGVRFVRDIEGKRIYNIYLNGAGVIKPHRKKR